MDKTYFLVADPLVGLVIKRARNPSVADRLSWHLISVSRRLFNSYHSGDMVLAVELDEPERSRWIAARQVAISRHYREAR